LAPRLLTDEAGRVVPVEPGHPDIEQYHVGPVRGCDLDRLLSVVSAADLVPPHLKESGKARGRVRIFVGAEDLTARRRGLRSEFSALRLLRWQGTGERQPYGEFTTLSGAVAACPDRPAVHFHQSPDQRKTDT